MYIVSQKSNKNGIKLFGKILEPEKVTTWHMNDYHNTRLDEQ